jgi:hypothetical protein
VPPQAFPSATAKERCDAIADAKTTDAAERLTFKFGCAAYTTEGGTLTACRASCSTHYSVTNDILRCQGGCNIRHNEDCRVGPATSQSGIVCRGGDPKTYGAPTSLYVQLFTIGSAALTNRLSTPLFTPFSTPLFLFHRKRVDGMLRFVHKQSELPRYWVPRREALCRHLLRLGQRVGCWAGAIV